MPKAEAGAIVVTRVAGAGGGLERRLTAAGIALLHFPALELKPLPASLPAARPDLAIFVSPAAVEHGYRLLAERMPVRCAAVGRATAARLAAAGVGEVLAPESGAGLAALLAELSAALLEGRRVLLVCGRPVNRRSCRLLADSGAIVTPFPVYERAAVQDPEPLAGWIESETADAIMVSSVAATEALAALSRLRFDALAWICSSPRVANAVRRAGGRVAAVAVSANDEDLAAAAIRWRQSEGRT